MQNSLPQSKLHPPTLPPKVVTVTVGVQALGSLEETLGVGVIVVDGRVVLLLGGCPVVGVAKMYEVDAQPSGHLVSLQGYAVVTVGTGPQEGVIVDKIKQALTEQDLHTVAVVVTVGQAGEGAGHPGPGAARAALLPTSVTIPIFN